MRDEVCMCIRVCAHIFVRAFMQIMCENVCVFILVCTIIHQSVWFLCIGMRVTMYVRVSIRVIVHVCVCVSEHVCV